MQENNQNNENNITNNVTVVTEQNVQPETTTINQNVQQEVDNIITNQETEQTNMEEPKKKNKVLIIVLVIIILALVGVGGYFAYNKFFANKEETTPAEKENKTEEPIPEKEENEPVEPEEEINDEEEPIIEVETFEYQGYTLMNITEYSKIFSDRTLVVDNGKVYWEEENGERAKINITAISNIKTGGIGFSDGEYYFLTTDGLVYYTEDMAGKYTKISSNYKFDDLYFCVNENINHFLVGKSGSKYYIIDVEQGVSELTTSGIDKVVTLACLGGFNCDEYVGIKNNNLYKCSKTKCKNYTINFTIKYYFETEFIDKYDEELEAYFDENDITTLESEYDYYSYLVDTNDNMYLLIYDFNDNDKPEIMVKNLNKKFDHAEKIGTKKNYRDEDVPVMLIHTTDGIKYIVSDAHTNYKLKK